MKFAATVINGWKNYQTSAQTDGEIPWNSVKFFCKSKSANDLLQEIFHNFYPIYEGISCYECIKV